MIWRYRGQERPAFADLPEPGQESVWDYPRPPVIAPDTRRIRVISGELLLADSTRACRVLETASAPGFYIPVEDVRMDLLRQTSGDSYCEWKGQATYYDLIAAPDHVNRVGWGYLKPLLDFSAIAGFIAFYPSKVECYVDGERARPQPGGFYGGWVTSDIVGPIKGAPGTSGW